MKQNNSLRVAMIGGCLPDSAHIRGGVQAASAPLIKGLARISGLELHVLLFRPFGWTGEDFFVQNGICVRLLPPVPRYERLHFYRRYQEIIDKALSQIQPDVVHAQEASANAYAALQSGFPTVITVHGIKGEDAKYCNSWKRRLRLYTDAILIERPVMRRIKYLVAISNYVTRYYSNTMRPDARLFFIPNAVEDLFFDANSRGTDATPRQEPSRPIVLFAGRVTPLKRVLDLIKAFAQVVREVPGAELHIAGECETEPNYVNIVKDYIRKAGLSKNIHLLGEMTQEELSREYRACDQVVLPSAQENAPMVLAQAMASGKPVIASRVGGVPEMVGENGERGLLVNVGDIDALASAIVRLLEDTALSDRLGQAGYLYAQENYLIDQVALRTYDVYQAIAAERRHDD
jgi:glycosyltransferase involved in cell wall biosynthesis